MTKKTVPPPSINLIRSPYVSTFLNALEPYVKYKTQPVGTWFRFNAQEKRYCYLVRTGIIHLYRQPEDVLLGAFEAPCIRGIIPETGNMELSFRVAAVSEIAVLEYDELMKIVEMHNLWDLFAKHMQIMVSSLFVHMTHVTPTNAYEAIRFQLLELMDSPESIRENITAEKYIRSKTQLSRSGIMRILAQLKAGGYIVLENGILKGMTSLPAKY